MTKIAIIVEGGCVQSVLSDDPDTRVELFDLDDASCLGPDELRWADSQVTKLEAELHEVG